MTRAYYMMPSGDMPDPWLFNKGMKVSDEMEEEYRIVNGLKLPPKRHVVVKRKVSSSPSVTGTPSTTNTGGGRGFASSEAHGEQNNEQNPPLPFGAIRNVFVELKKKFDCKDIVFPEQPEFQKKWAALAKGIAEKMGNGPIRQDALALIDCTVFGGCEHGVLIGKSGIYVVNEDSESGGWLDWGSFIEKAEIARESRDELMICPQPRLGVDISGCGLTVAQAHKLFGRVLHAASGGKARASQVRPISMRDRLKDWTVYGIGILVALALLGLGYWGIKCYAHVQNVEKAFTMMCERHLPGFKGVVSVDVPMWNRFGSNKYQCSAKIKVAKEGKSEETLDVTFVAKRVSAAGVIKDTVNAARAFKALNDGKVDKAMDRMAQVDDDWDVNMGFWGWIGDDYHIGDVEVK